MGTTFTLTDQHLQLLAHMTPRDGLSETEAGAPEFDGKRPYGNSEHLADIVEILHGPEAIRIEEDSEKLYREQAGRETDEKRQALLNRIADEEKSHIYLIDNMIHYLADPQGFALSQQFAQFKSWEGR